MKPRVSNLHEEARKRFLDHPSLSGGLGTPSELCLDEFIDTYLSARYWALKGSRARPFALARELDDDLAERFILLQHGLNREATLAAWRLGGFAAVFDVLWNEDNRIGARGDAP